jgi:hypothetical protein
MSDWTEFTEAVPWFLNDDAVVKVGKRRAPRGFSPAAAKLFPRLAELLAMGSVTDVSVDGIAYELVAWNSFGGDRFGWLCLRRRQQCLGVFMRTIEICLHLLGASSNVSTPQSALARPAPDGHRQSSAARRVSADLLRSFATTWSPPERCVPPAAREVLHDFAGELFRRWSPQRWAESPVPEFSGMAFGSPSACAASVDPQIA